MILQRNLNIGEAAEGAVNIQRVKGPLGTSIMSFKGANFANVHRPRGDDGVPLEQCRMTTGEYKIAPWLQFPRPASIMRRRGDEGRIMRGCRKRRHK